MKEHFTWAVLKHALFCLMSWSFAQLSSLAGSGSRVGSTRTTCSRAFAPAWPISPYTWAFFLDTILENHRNSGAWFSTIFWFRIVALSFSGLLTVPARWGALGPSRPNRPRTTNYKKIKTDSLGIRILFILFVYTKEIDFPCFPDAWCCFNASWTNKATIVCRTARAS